MRKLVAVSKGIGICLAVAAFLAFAYAQWDTQVRADYACWYANKDEPAEKAITQLRNVAAVAGAKVTNADGRVTAVFDWLGWEMTSCTITHKDGRVLAGSRTRNR